MSLSLTIQHDEEKHGYSGQDNPCAVSAYFYLPICLRIYYRHLGPNTDARYTIFQYQQYCGPLSIIRRFGYQYQ
jgi:hypothetical protein